MFDCTWDQYGSCAVLLPCVELPQHAILRCSYGTCAIPISVWPANIDTLAAKIDFSPDCSSCPRR